MNWAQALKVIWPIITAICATLLGANYNEAAIEGVGSVQQSMGIGGLTFATAFGLFMTVVSNWKKAGGKLDGKIEPEELKAVVNTVLPKYKNITDQFAPEAATLANMIGQYVQEKLGGGKKINIFNSEDGTAMNHTNRTFVWSLVDGLAEILAGDPEGEDAVATIRHRLDMLLFPESPRAKLPKPADPAK